MVNISKVDKLFTHTIISIKRETNSNSLGLVSRERPLFYKPTLHNFQGFPINILPTLKSFACLSIWTSFFGWFPFFTWWLHFLMSFNSDILTLYRNSKKNESNESLYYILDADRVGSRYSDCCWYLLILVTQWEFSFFQFMQEPARKSLYL